MKIDPYISELLFNHDCVIVSDLGGFIANYKPASINPALHVISPPSKKLAFNASLKNNDGLLANHISQRTLLNYTDACEVIRDYVKDATAGMKDGRKLNIEKVGVLYIDQQENIQFLPDQHANYLIESFGMAPVHAPVIRRTVIESPNVPVSGVIDSSPVEHRKGELRIFGWRVLEMIPAAAILAILIMTPPVLKEFNSNLSSLLPFSRMNEYLETIKGNDREKQHVVIPHINPFEIPAARSTSKPVLNQTPVPISDVPPESEVTKLPPPVKSETEIVNAVPEAGKETSNNSAISSPVVVAAESANSYYVIGGCFRSEENAKKFVSEMKAKNMDAAIIGQNRSGLYMVSLYSSSSFNQATDVLPEIKSNVVQSAWVYQK